MFFALSKILWFLAKPETVFLGLLGIGTLLLWIRTYRRIGRICVTATLLLGLGIAIFPVGSVVLSGLEDRFPPIPRADLPSVIGGIIVLGGVLDQFVSSNRGQVSLNASAERLTEFAALAKRYPDAKLVFSGGSGSLIDQSMKEADYVAPFLEEIGIDPGRVIFENQSRNTFENATLSRERVAYEPGKAWILITSAFHMPRAVGCFRQAGWTVIPYPVDFSYRRGTTMEPTFAFATGLGKLDAAIHEWLGLFVYWMTNRTGTLFPGPEETTPVASKT